MGLAVMTVEPDGNEKIQNFLVELLLHLVCGFIPSRVERLYVVNSSIRPSESH